MEIGGFQRVSLIDYPGKVTSIVFLTGCNLRCPFCHNPDLVFKKVNELKLYGEEAVLKLLEESKDFVDAVEITGGEPSLQKGLKDFIKKCKDIGLSVKLDTNGSNPDIVRSLISEKLVDYIAMDIKAPLNDESQMRATGIGNIHIFKQVRETARILLNSNIKYEFRTTAVPGIVTIEDLVEIAKSINGAQSYYIQKFVPGNTLDPAFNHIKSYSIAELNDSKKKIEEMKLVGKCEVRY